MPESRVLRHPRVPVGLVDYRIICGAIYYYHDGEQEKRVHGGENDLLTVEDLQNYGTYSWEPDVNLNDFCLEQESRVIKKFEAG